MVGGDFAGTEFLGKSKLDGFMRPAIALTSIWMLAACVVTADEIEFDRDIRPILSENCYHCHGPDAKKREAELRLDTRDGLLAKRDDLHVVVPGKPAESELIRRISSSDEDEQMPPPETKLALSEREKNLLRAWIESGAEWNGHWSFEPIVRPDVPQTASDWPRNEIDRFVFARLQVKGLQPLKQAAKERLLRRVTLDLSGLPPTLKEIDAFLTDDSPTAFESVVDRLLGSSAYGERMAWDWLDAARYADSNGFQGDRERTMWPWRSWVIRSLNANMPFDQFTIQQIAGDLLPNASLDQNLATAFLRNHMINGEGGRIAEENRIEYLFDQTETVGTIWMGLTLTCSRCHDHKYDPLLQSEYYQLVDFFNQTPVNGGGGDPNTAPVIDVPPEESLRRLEELNAKLAAIKKMRAARAAELVDQQRQWEAGLLADGAESLWDFLQPQTVAAVHQKLTVQKDQTILAGGPNPKNDTYTVAAMTGKRRVTGIRLEALRHPSLTRNSLSRADSGNFVLTGFEISVRHADDAQPISIGFVRSEATYEQENHKISTAYNGDSKTGWAVHEGRVVDREHAAVFQFSEAIEMTAASKLTVSLRHDSPHANHNLGRFRLSVTDQVAPHLQQANSLLELLRIAAEDRTAEQRERIANEFLKSDKRANELLAAQQKIGAEIAAVPKGSVKVMVMRDMPNRRKTFVLTKGLYNQPTEKQVSAGFPSVFSRAALSSVTETSEVDRPRNRLTLARWLVDRSHPLMPRVTVNRHWQKFFGHGFVKSAEDFGTQGQKPTHPRLLDWLAVEFMESGWDVKALHKKIVMSATYRQTARASAAAHRTDPENRLLARGPRSRLPSWMLRDQALAVSGLLVRQIGGPSVKPYQPAGVWAEATFGKKRYAQDHGDKLYRRSLYTFWRRIIGPTMFFDVAKRQTCSVKTARTNTPLHALVTLNDTTYVEAARALAQRVMQAESGAEQRITAAFRLCATRRPQQNEIKVLADRLKTLRQQYGRDPGAAAKLLKVGESPRDEGLDAVQHAAFTNLCLLLLNLDETLSR